MGFFNIGKFVNRIVSPVIHNPVKAVSSAINQVIRDPVRFSIGVASGGVSEVARSAPVIGGIVKEGTSFASSVYKVGASAYTGGLYGITTGIADQLTAPKGDNMAFNTGQFLGGLQGILGQSANPYLSGAGNIAQLASAFFPQASAPMQQLQVYQPMAAAAQPISMSAAVPAIRSSGRGLTQEVFNAGTKVLQRLGISYPATTSGFSSVLKRALGSIASLARRTPAGTLVALLTGLGLAAQEAYLLTAWQAQRKRHRRMNPANAKALRRSVRRIQSFHKLCRTADVLKSRGRTSSTSRCGTCKQKKCRC